ncbi:glycosyltransferase [Gramella sp. BOM4]|nr:glycosyltransferase [Christiangramia bathymodioli]
MKISIITATYNSAKSISSTLASISSQSYNDIELVIVDGASSDYTVELIKNSYSRKSKIISEYDNGIYDALNKGVKMATGDVVGFVHSDDYLADSDVIFQIAEILKNDRVDGVYGDLHYVDKVNTDRVIRYWQSQDFEPGLLKKGWMPAHPTMFLRKEVYQKHGLFNLDYKIAADYDLMLRIFSDATLKFKYLPKVITKMRVGGASNRSLKNILRKSKEDLRALKRNNIKRPYLALANKNLSKITQFIKN